MNKKLGPGILLLLSLVLLYLSGTTFLGSALGIGMSIGGIVCFIAAIVGFVQKAFRRNKKD